MKKSKATWYYKARVAAKSTFAAENAVRERNEGLQWTFRVLTLRPPRIIVNGSRQVKTTLGHQGEREHKKGKS